MDCVGYVLYIHVCNIYMHPHPSTCTPTRVSEYTSNIKQEGIEGALERVAGELEAEKKKAEEGRAALEREQ